MKRTLPVILTLLLLGGLFSCTQKSEYEQLVERELSRDVRMDSLFLGYYFGMPLEEFLSHSLELNRSQTITGGAKIKYRFDRLDQIAIMEFYPEFRDRQIVELPIEVQYEGWAPWNTHLASDSLIADLIHHYEDRFDTSFITHTFEGDESPSYVAVQGNRQIRIYRKSTQLAGIDFIDLTAQVNTQ
jgi:hypothetical protein